jgi:hypothetical protein
MLQIVELRKPTITLGAFTHKNLTIEGIILTQYVLSCATREIVPSAKYLCTESAIALALGCSQTRLHKATVRTRCFEQKPKTIERLEDALEIWEAHCERLSLKGSVYNPLHLYKGAIKDLAFRRPYLNTARVFYLADGGQYNSHFARLGLVK